MDTLDAESLSTAVGGLTRPTAKQAVDLFGRAMQSAGVALERLDVQRFEQPFVNHGELMTRTAPFREAFDAATRRANRLGAWLVHRAHGK